MKSEVAAELVGRAASHGMRLAAAESLTGGLVASSIVSVPGASRVFTGGIVAYDTALKRSLLGVDSELLARQGPVDRDVAVQMAEGARRACAIVGADRVLRDADLGVATTGVAGPDPDAQSGQAAGTVWVSVSGPGEEVRVQLVPGLAGRDRTEIREAATHAALCLLNEALRQHARRPGESGAGRET